MFCCVGTTQKKAGSTEAFQRVDRDIPIALARWAAACGARCFVGISSVDARATARSVYLKTKGEMERGVAAAGVGSTYILRPSLLAGGRDEYRLAERVGNRVLAVIEPVMLGPLRKYRAVHTKTVARAMLACADQHAPGVHIVEFDVVQKLGGLTPLLRQAPARTISRLSLTMPDDGFPATPSRESNFKRLRDTVQSFPVSSRRLAVGSQASVRRSAR